LLAQIPHLLSGYVTRIAPGAVIKPHCGETNAHLRIHLGLHVPDVPPSVCGMQIGGKTVGWKNGEAFAFLDAHEHHVWNKSKHYRYILIVDVLRPEFVPRKSFVYARVIVSQLVYFSLSLLRVPHLDKIPPGLLSTITYVLYLPIVVTTWFGNKLGLFKL
jgi:aspartyl/asparaginyl beta-hydroxylase (cupin superfamily)